MMDSAAGMALTLSDIERRLREHRPKPLEGTTPDDRRAAVACLLRATALGPEVLLMKRAEHPGDRWSGHVSFPGGREEPGDGELRITAVRETREEVGIDLDATGRLVGQLDTIRAVARARVTPLTITPFVFVQTRPAPLRLNHEAVATFWLPLAQAASGQLGGEYPYRFGDETRVLPCWRFGGHIVWGLTYQMLAHLIAVIA